MVLQNNLKMYFSNAYLTHKAPDLPFKGLVFDSRRSTNFGLESKFDFLRDKEH